MAAQVQVVIGTYTLQINPRNASKPQPVSASPVVTLGGGYMSSFYDPTNSTPGIFVFDQIHTLEWPVLRASQYNQLETIKNQGIIQTYTDWTGVSYHAFIEELTYSSINPSSLDAFLSVKMTMRMISQP